MAAGDHFWQTFRDDVAREWAADAYESQRLALEHLRNGQISEAVERYEHALFRAVTLRAHLARQGHVPLALLVFIADLCAGAAASHYAADSLDDALMWFQRALAIEEQLGNRPVQMAAALAGMARVYYRKGDPGRGHDLMQLAQAADPGFKPE